MFTKISQLENSYILNLTSHTDLRGSLTETFQIDALRELPGWEDFNIKQQNFVISVKNSIRGIHLTKAEFPQRKIVFVAEGVIREFLINLNSNSTNFKETFSFNLSSEEPRILLLGANNGHSFQTESETSRVVYCFDRKFDANQEMGLNPLKLRITPPWKSPSILSDKDSQAISLQEALDKNIF